MAGGPHLSWLVGSWGGWFFRDFFSKKKSLTVLAFTAWIRVFQKKAFFTSKTCWLWFQTFLLCWLPWLKCVLFSLIFLNLRSLSVCKVIVFSNVLLYREIFSKPGNLFNFKFYFSLKKFQGRSVGKFFEI